MKNLLASLALPVLVLTAPLSTWAGNNHEHYPERKEEFWDRGCKVEREWKKDGEYQDKRECKGRHGYHSQYDQYGGHYRHHDRKEVFWDRGCKVEREWKKDGEYQDKRECKRR